MAVRLTPGAAADHIDGWDADSAGRAFLKIRVRARPVDGEANAALIGLLAKALGVPRGALSLMRGGQSRLKMLEVDGVDDAGLRARLTDP